MNTQKQPIHTRSGARSPGRDRAAFTLIEVMMAAFVMVMVFAAAYSSLGHSLNVVDSARRQNRANQIIQSEMERLRLYNWDEIWADPDASLMKRQNYINEEFNIESDFFEDYAEGFTGVREMEVTRWDSDTGEADQLKIIVTVKWNSRQGKEQKLSVFTFYTRQGVNDYYYTKPVEET